MDNFSGAAMHLTITRWLRELWHSHPDLFHGKRVLDVGSSAVSGSAAPLFSDCQYVGLDARPGPNVDVVCLAHQYQPEQPFDVVVCCSTLEHDPFWKQSLKHMPELLIPGGALILAFPGPDWPVHEVECAPMPGYYRNLEADEVLEVIEGKFEQVEVRRGDRETFVLATGRKGD